MSANRNRIPKFASAYIQGTMISSNKREVLQKICRQYRLRPSGVIYDVTNTYLYGRHCPLAKLGHDKEQGKGRPLIQIGLAVTQEEGFPVFHKVFDGNVHDARTLQDLVTQFRSYELGPDCLSMIGESSPDATSKISSACTGIPCVGCRSTQA